MAVLTAKAAQLFALLACYAVGGVAAVPIDLLEPAMDRRRARLKLPRQILHAAPGSSQRNDLSPNSAE